MTRHPRVLLVVAVSYLAACGGPSRTAAQRMPHPDDPGRSVEYFLEAPTSEAPWPTVVLLHGHQELVRPGGKAFVEWGVLESLASRGYLAVAISQPGYGGSSGPADFSGPYTQRAVAGVIARLRAEGLASPTRLLIEGISRGAVTAGLVAAQDSTIAGLVVISGLYDLPAFAARDRLSGTARAIVAAMRSETDGSDSALATRSILRRSGAIHAATLILNGADDDRTDPDQARALAEALTRRGVRARAIVYPGVGHAIPMELRRKDVDTFIDTVLGIERR